MPTPMKIKDCMRRNPLTIRSNDNLIQAVETLVEQWFREDAQQRITVWVSHQVDQLHRVADRMLRIDRGQVSED